MINPEELIIDETCLPENYSDRQHLFLNCAQNEFLCTQTIKVFTYTTNLEIL